MKEDGILTTIYTLRLINEELCTLVPVIDSLQAMATLCLFTRVRYTLINEPDKLYQSEVYKYSNSHTMNKSTLTKIMLRIIILIIKSMYIYRINLMLQN